MTGICCIIFPKVFFCYLETFFTIQSLGVILCRKLWLVIIFWLMIWLVLLRKSSKKNIWNFPDLVGGWVWKSSFSRFKKIKNMLSKCIKMPKYSFKRYLFFAIWGGVTDWVWPTHHTSHALKGDQANFYFFKKIKNMLSKCIKMPKYSFKRYLFFAI